MKTNVHVLFALFCLLLNTAHAQVSKTTQTSAAAAVGAGVAHYVVTDARKLEQRAHKLSPFSFGNTVAQPSKNDITHAFQFSKKGEVFSLTVIDKKTKKASKAVLTSLSSDELTTLMERIENREVRIKNFTRTPQPHNALKKLGNKLQLAMVLSALVSVSSHIYSQLLPEKSVGRLDSQRDSEKHLPLRATAGQSVKKVSAKSN